MIQVLLDLAVAVVHRYQIAVRILAIVHCLTIGQADLAQMALRVVKAQHPSQAIGHRI